MRVDLHAHTTASDGTLTPDRLVERALDASLDALAVTDHDSVEAVDATLEAASAVPLEIVPGVELSAVYRGHDVHILGFFVDHTDAAFCGALEQLRGLRHERAAAIVDQLRDAGYDVTLAEVLRMAEGGSVGRSHVARVLVGKGHAESVGDAFERLIGRGKPFYVPKPVSEPVVVVRTILDAGGVPVLAHPGITKVDELIEPLVDAGLLGLEAYHGEHALETRERYARMAHELGLITTGGSDYHGPSAPGVALGHAEVPPHVYDDLLAARERLLTS
jgi:predicted metal-dependent phosphoesterase TrpH